MSYSLYRLIGDGAFNVKNAAIGTIRYCFTDNQN